MRAAVIILVLLIAFGSVTAQPAAPITPDNADSLQRLSLIGPGTLLDVMLTQDETKLAAVTTRGIYFYSAHDLNASPTFIDFDLSETAFVPPYLAHLVTVQKGLDQEVLVITFPRQQITVDLATETIVVVDEPVARALQNQYSPARLLENFDGVHTAEIIYQPNPVLEVTTNSRDHTATYLDGLLCGNRQEILATADGTKLYVVDYGSGASIFALDTISMSVTSYAAGFGATVTDFAFAPDGTTLVVTAVNASLQCSEATASNAIYSYDLTSGQLLNAAHSSIVPMAVEVGNDVMLVGGINGIEVWRGGEVISTIENENLRFITSAEFSPSGQYAVFSTSLGQLYIWDAMELEVGGPLLALMATANGLSSRTFAVMDDILIYFENNNVHAFSLGAYSDITVFDIGEPVRGLDYHADTQRLAVVTLAQDQLARVLTLYQFTMDAEADPELLIEIENLPTGLDIVRFSPDGSLVLVSADASGDRPGPNTLAYSAETGERVETFSGEGGAPLTFNADGTALSVSIFGSMIAVYTTP